MGTQSTSLCCQINVYLQCTASVTQFPHFHKRAHARQRGGGRECAQSGVLPESRNFGRTTQKVPIKNNVRKKSAVEFYQAFTKKTKQGLNHCLKVGGNEKNGGSGRSQMLDNGLGPWRSRFIFNLNVQFLSKMSYFRFRL
jgi:hypothetical protein